MATEKTKEQLQAEAAAKKAADKVDAQKKADAEQKLKDEAKQKEDAAIAEATVGYTKIQTAVQAGNTIQGTLTEQSNVDDVKKAQTDLAVQVKEAKDGLKTVKAAARKVKDSENLKSAVADSEKLVAGLEAVSKGVKDKLDAAKKVTAEQARVDREKKAEQAKLDKQAEKDAKAKAREDAKEPEQNGIRKPSAGTLCRAAWDIFDAVSGSLGSTAPISYVLPVAMEKGLNEANVKAEYARWKKYMGISGRVAVPVPASVTAAAANVSIPSNDAGQSTAENTIAE